MVHAEAQSVLGRAAAGQGRSNDPPPRRVEGGDRRVASRVDDGQLEALGGPDDLDRRAVDDGVRGPENLVAADDFVERPLQSVHLELP